MWEIEKIVSKGEYNYAIVRNHPNRTKNDYVLHHRIVMENHLGRLLDKDEVVHHLDENKKNNDISNLELMTRFEHNRMHSTTGRIYITCTCPICGKIFDREPRQIRPNSNPKCSRKCNGIASRRIQLGREV